MDEPAAPPNPRRRRGLLALLGAGSGLLALACAGALLVGWALLQRASGEEPLPAAASNGDPAPDFTLSDLDGQTVRLSDFRGRPVLVNFFATWCGPCRVEMPDLARAQQQHADQGLVVLEVDQQESAGQVRGFVSELGLSLPVLLDPDGAVGRRYGARFLPTTVFIDRKGVIQRRFVGALGRVTIEQRLADILPNTP